MSAILGYGYDLIKEHFPIMELSENEIRDWYESLYTSPYCINLNDNSFFGIVITEVYDGLKKVSDSIDGYWEEWPMCQKEFKKFFPNSEQKPELYILDNTGW